MNVIQLPLTLKMTTAQVFETPLVTVKNTSIQDCIHPDDHTQPILMKVTVVVLFLNISCTLLRANQIAGITSDFKKDIINTKLGTSHFNHLSHLFLVRNIVNRTSLVHSQCL